MAERRPSLLLAARRPSRAAGVSTAALAITVTTLVLYPLRELTSAVSLGVVYLLSVLLVSTYWGALFGVATALASAAAFNFFHIEPTGRFTIADGENWVALGVYVAAAIAVSSIAEAARARAAEGEQRRREADLGAELARLLMTHRALLVEVWGPQYASDTQILRTHIANLRRKIEPAGEGPRYIRTDPGVGSRLAT